MSQTKILIYAGAVAGTAWMYQKLGLLDEISNIKKKSFNDVIKELKPQLLAACFYWDGLPSIIDEKDPANAALKAKLYYYGSPIDYKTAPFVGEIPLVVERPSDPNDFWGSIAALGQQAARDAGATQAYDERYRIYNTMIEIININNSSLPQKVPTEESLNVQRNVYNQNKNKIVQAWDSGIKTRIPHEPFLSCLPIVFEIIRKAGYSSLFNENMAVYRTISFQETMRREIPQESDEKKAIIVDGINIETGKTVVEEPPPPGSVVIPTKGPHAGQIIPIEETAIL